MTTVEMDSMEELEAESDEWEAASDLDLQRFENNLKDDN